MVCVRVQQCMVSSKVVSCHEGQGYNGNEGFAPWQGWVKIGSNYGYGTVRAMFNVTVRAGDIIRVHLHLGLD